MAEINKTPAPQEMIRLIAREADDFMQEFGEQGDCNLHDEAIRLIAQAWNLPATNLDTCLAALREERERASEAVGDGVGQETGAQEGGIEGACASEFDLPVPNQLLSLLWGFFGTAVLLNGRADRNKILEIAVYLMDCLGLDDAIPEPCPDRVGH